MENTEIIETVHRFFISVDERQWDQTLHIFAPVVLLDYTSMAGGTPASLEAAQITESWKTLLPGFDSTHHQLGNHVVTLKNNQAGVFCYGTAGHYLKNDSGENTWTVVGSYNIMLVKENGRWRITGLRFNLKYTEGNQKLPGMATERLKK